MATEVTKIKLASSRPGELSSRDATIVQAAFDRAGFPSVVTLHGFTTDVAFVGPDPAKILGRQPGPRPTPVQASQIFDTVRARLNVTQEASMDTVLTETMSLKI